MSRNFGLGPSERFPDGCDWHKPPGCTCRLLCQREACYENCDDIPTIEAYTAALRRRRWVALLLFVAWSVSAVMAVVVSAGLLK